MLFFLGVIYFPMNCLIKDLSKISHYNISTVVLDNVVHCLTIDFLVYFEVFTPE